VQSADGNFHELVSHLGLTHLLIEPFVVATHRHLAQEHPLYLLLLPHFQGTLFINNAALESLISPGGPVDQLLAGTIQSDWNMTTNALATLDFNARMLPANLAGRGVDDPAVLPNYPYRDDALLVWKSIHDWAHDYLSLYYNTDADVVGDSELQAWVGDLVSSEGGCVGGFGESNAAGSKGIFTLAYLENVVTMLIFTASAQHASVNFPQLSIMSYTPVMPLATYAPAPTRVSAELSANASLAALPPLEVALIQLVVGQLLGGIYFTRLGEYNLHQRTPWFTDARVNGPLEAFQNNLAGVERTIGVRNQTRACYEPLLPSRIPQSINI
jgi:arachidonate 15-lipoxygenase